MERVGSIHAASRGTYGALRIHAELRASGERHGRKRIARLMREAGLVGASHRRGGPATTRRDREARPAPDLVERNLAAVAPNQLWVADITPAFAGAGSSWPVAMGFMHLAVVLDAFSRRVVGWSMANHLRTELVLDALEMAVGQRKPDDVVDHSDQGSHCTSLAFGARVPRRPACAPPWARWATPTTTRCARASSPRWRASFWPAAASAPRPRRRRPPSATWKASTTPGACTPRWGADPPSPPRRTTPERPRPPQPTKTPNRPPDRGKPSCGGSRGRPGGGLGRPVDLGLVRRWARRRPSGGASRPRSGFGHGARPGASRRPAHGAASRARPRRARRRLGGSPCTARRSGGSG